MSNYQIPAHIDMSLNLERDRSLPYLAEAFGVLHDQGYSIADIAKICNQQSRQWVATVLSLRDLSENILIRVKKGEVSADVALQIARITDEKAQRAALAKLENEGSADSSMATRSLIRDEYLRPLKTARFPLDLQLPQGSRYSGRSCWECPFRSSKRAYLFTIEEQEADLCLIPTCWELKRAAHTSARAAEPSSLSRDTILQNQSLFLENGALSPTGSNKWIDLDKPDDLYEMLECEDYHGSEWDEAVIGFAELQTFWAKDLAGNWRRLFPLQWAKLLISNSQKTAPSIERREPKSFFAIANEVAHELVEQPHVIEAALRGASAVLATKRPTNPRRVLFHCVSALLRGFNIEHLEGHDLHSTEDIRRLMFRADGTFKDEGVAMQLLSEIAFLLEMRYGDLRDSKWINRLTAFGVDWDQCLEHARSLEGGADALSE